HGGHAQAADQQHHGPLAAAPRAERDPVGGGDRVVRGQGERGVLGHLGRLLGGYGDVRACRHTATAGAGRAACTAGGPVTSGTPRVPEGPCARLDSAAWADAGSRGRTRARCWGSGGSSGSSTTAARATARRWRAPSPSPARGRA